MGRWIAFLLALIVSMGTAVAGELVQTLTLKESFGISHPEQVIDFDLTQQLDAEDCYLLGADGNEVPYQFIEDGRKLALRTDLPAGATRNWKLMKGRAPKPVTGGVKVIRTDTCYEITNELTGIRIPLAQVPGQKTLAPIQGIRYRDGTWTATGPNYLSRAARTMDVRLLEQGPIKVVARVAYTADQPPGAYYRSTIEVQAGEPCILFMEDGRDFDVTYDLDVSQGLNPDRVRSVRTGDGASLDRDYTMRLAVWDLWIRDGGHYLQAYNSEAPPTANVFGLFPGPTAPALGAGRSGMRMVVQDGELRVRMQLEHQNLADRTLTHNRFCWGAFLGLRSEAVSGKVQEIELLRNRHSGINLNKFHRLDLDFPEPPGKYGCIYMTRQQLDDLINRVRTDEEYYQFLRHADGYFIPVLEMWRDSTGRLVHEAATKVEEKARQTLEMLLNRRGIYEKDAAYYEGVFFFLNYFYMGDQVLASELATDEDRAKVKKSIVLWGSIFTDDNHAPMQEDTGLPYGTLNQPLTYKAFRDMFIVYLSGKPEYRERVKGVVERTAYLLKKQINEYGSHMSGMHYVQASLAPLLNNMQQLKQAGIYDFFKHDAEYGYRMTRFSEFAMNALTPPEPRFGNVRKMIATGQGSTESSDRYGCLGTGFAGANEELSMRLMAAWRQNGRSHQSQHGSSIIKIDDALPGKDPALGSANFPGYYSVLREEWGTPNETAVWLVCGDWYRDHRDADAGEVIIYALGAPLATEFGCMYTPRANGPEDHSIVQEGGWSWNSNIEAFEELPGGAFSRAVVGLDKGKWTRAVSLAMVEEDLPVIAIQDFFTDKGPKTWQLNCMSEGQAETVSTGDFTRLSMKGQLWKAHATKGIDWDVYIVEPNPPQVSFGEWEHHWHPAPEREQFRRANAVDRFREYQQKLRLTGDGPFRVFIVPYFKGKKPTGVSVKLVGDDVAVSAAGKTVTFKANGSFSL